MCARYLITGNGFYLYKVKVNLKIFNLHALYFIKP